MVFTFQPPFFAGLSGYVAEIGSAFLCAALGIVPTVRHADYLASWLAVLREDAAVRGTGGPRGRAIFRAASAASKAADWILARHAEPKPFRWIKSADDILSAVKRFRQKTEQALCTEL